MYLEDLIETVLQLDYDDSVVLLKAVKEENAKNRI